MIGRTSIHYVWHMGGNVLIEACRADKGMRKEIFKSGFRLTHISLVKLLMYRTRNLT